jgi:hypothetical protein
MWPGGSTTGSKVSCSIWSRRGVPPTTPRCPWGPCLRIRFRASASRLVPGRGGSGAVARRSRQLSSRGRRRCGGGVGTRRGALFLGQYRLADEPAAGNLRAAGTARCGPGGGRRPACACVAGRRLGRGVGRRRERTGHGTVRSAACRGRPRRWGCQWDHHARGERSGCGDSPRVGCSLRRLTWVRCARPRSEEIMSWLCAQMAGLWPGAATVWVRALCQPTSSRWWRWRRALNSAWL